MDLVGFALAVLLIELTPGPNMTWLAGLAATEGRQVGLAAVGGVALGLMANGLLAALGLAALLRMAPDLWNLLRIAGAAMMLWLALQAWRGSAGQGGGAMTSATRRTAFATGAFINLLNPKAYIFFVVVAPRFLPQATLQLKGALILATISTVIATTIHALIVLAGSRAHGWLAAPERTRLARRCFALVMIAVAASFLLADQD